MKRPVLVFVCLIYLLGLVYLALPAPAVEPLPGALRSDEPGDTWQNPDQAAYFTDLYRAEVLSFYQNSFSLKFLGWQLPLFRLNYRPEDTAQYIRPHIDSYFLEEVVHPLRESLFINGWYPNLSPQLTHLPPEELAEKMIHVNDRGFNGKITLKPYYSSLPGRWLVWTLIFPATYLAFTQLKSSLAALKDSLIHG